ncbi:MAG: membrane protein insertion efficiency factor YidD [bacterium]
MKKPALWLIKLYQKFLSPDQSIWVKKMGQTQPLFCKFEPTCSQYTYEAIDKYGIVKGVFMGAWRILRCNPFTKGGHDPVK